MDNIDTQYTPDINRVHSALDVEDGTVPVHGELVSLHGGRHNHNPEQIVVVVVHHVTIVAIGHGLLKVNCCTPSENNYHNFSSNSVSFNKYLKNVDN